MQRRIVLINGHPDPSPGRFCAALCRSYAEGARQAGWDMRRLDIGSLLCCPDQDDEALDEIFHTLGWATQFTIIFPLWLGGAPPSLHCLFAKQARRMNKSATLTVDRFARTIITMDMPAFAHRALLQRNISPTDLEAGMALPGLLRQEREFIGSVNTISAEQRALWLATLHKYGVDGR